MNTYRVNHKYRPDKTRDIEAVDAKTAAQVYMYEEYKPSANTHRFSCLLEVDGEEYLGIWENVTPHPYGPTCFFSSNKCSH